MAKLQLDIIGNPKSAVDAVHKVGAETGKAADRVHKSFGRVGESLSKVTKFAALAVGGAALGGLVAVFKTGVDEQRDFLAGQAQLANGIKTTGGAAHVTVAGLEGLASSIQNMSGQTDDSIVASEKLLLTFTGVRNEVGKGNDVFNQATQASADMAAKMGGDASKYAIQLGKALNDPVKGLTALTRVGVSFTTGQKNQIGALVKSGHTLQAQKIILGELNKEFGGSAKAAGQTLPGQLARAKRSFEDISQSVLSALMPVLVRLGSFLTQHVIPAFQAAVAWVVAHWPQIGAVISKVWAVVVGYWNAVGRPLLAAELNAVRAVVGWVVQHWPQIQAALVAAWGAIKPVLVAFADLLRTLWVSVLQPIVRWVQAHWSQISTVMKIVAIAVAVAAKVLAVALTIEFRLMAVSIRVFAAYRNWLWHSIVMPVFNGISAVIRFNVAGWRAIINTAIGTVRAIGGAFQHAYTDTRRWISNIVTAVTSLPSRIAGLAGRMLNAGKALMGGLWNGLKSAGGAVADFGRQLVDNVIDLLNRVLPHHIGIHKGPLNFSVPLFPDIPHLSAGGVTRGPTLALIGDNPGGREAVVPLPSGGGLGGGDVHIHVQGTFFGTPAEFGRAVGAALETASRQGVKFNIARAVV